MMIEDYFKEIKTGKTRAVRNKDHRDYPFSVSAEENKIGPCAPIYEDEYVLELKFGCRFYAPDESADLIRGQAIEHMKREIWDAISDDMKIAAKFEVRKQIIQELARLPYCDPHTELQQKVDHLIKTLNADG